MNDQQMHPRVHQASQIEEQSMQDLSFQSLEEVSQHSAIFESMGVPADAEIDPRQCDERYIKENVEVTNLRKRLDATFFNQVFRQMSAADADPAAHGQK